MSKAEKMSMDSLNKLKNFLRTEGIDISRWGKGEAKTIEQFFREIEKGESVLKTGEDGELIRELVICGADVFYTLPGGRKLRLKEQKQVFYDGRVRYRDYGHAVSEKISPNEDPKEGILRGIREELGIGGEMPVKEVKKDEKFQLSNSYPGLMSHYIRFIYDVELEEDQFNPEGYVEHGSTCITYFIWEETE